jgi:hypothetical protein
MARKVIDVQPILTARFVGGTSVTTQESARRQVEDTIAILKPDFECTVTFETDARCEHCNNIWTEDDATYNGGCCAADQENDPELEAALKGETVPVPCAPRVAA